MSDERVSVPITRSSDQDIRVSLEQLYKYTTAPWFGGKTPAKAKPNLKANAVFNNLIALWFKSAQRQGAILFF